MVRFTGGRRARLPLLFGLLVLALGGALAPSVLAAGDPAARLRVVTVAGEVIVDVPLASDRSWELAWLHSVALVVVRDAFAWREGRMWLTDQRTPYLDIAGLGHVPGRGELRDDGQGGFWIAGIDEPLAGNVLRFVIGSDNAPTTLVHDGRRHELSATHPGVRAHVEVLEP